MKKKKKTDSARIIRKSEDQSRPRSRPKNGIVDVSIDGGEQMWMEKIDANRCIICELFIEILITVSGGLISGTNKI